MSPFPWRLLAAALCSMAALPAAEYSTYIGDSNPVSVSRLISDSAGNVYLAGSRTFNLGNGPLSEAIVMKLDLAGKTILLANLSGKGNDVASGVAVDGAGNIYVAGQTSSPDFPLLHALYPSPPTPTYTGYAGFLTKFNPDASQILYSTYFPEPVVGLAVDSAGNAYLTGTTQSPSFPVTQGLPAGRVGGYIPIVYGAFLTKISAAGDRIVYSTVIAGYAKSCGCCSSCFTSDRHAGGAAVAVDAAGNAYIAGNTDVSDLPATPGAWLASGVGAFVGKVNAAGTALSYLTYLGTGAQVVQPYISPATRATALAVDAAGNAFVTGDTFDPNLPVTPGAFQTTFHGWSRIDIGRLPPVDAFALKLNPTGTAVVWGSYLGGNGADAATSAAVDSAGNLWVAGTTKSTEFPDVQGWSTGGDFIVEFNSSGTALLYSARYPDGSASQTLAVDSKGLLHVATANGVVSAVAAVPRPAIRPWLIANAAGGTPGGQIAAGELVVIYGPHIGAFPAVQATSTSSIVPSILGGAQVFFNDIAAPILYASDGQINAVVPFEVAGQGGARIRIANQGVTGPEFIAAVLPAIPQVFTNAPVSADTGYSAAAALNEDGTVNGPANPAKAGSVVSIWATGVSPPFPAVPDGQIAAGANNFGCCGAYSNFYSVPFSPTYLNVSYGGAAPGMVAGVVQINFQATANGPVVLTAGSPYSRPLFASDPVWIFVKP